MPFVRAGDLDLHVQLLGEGAPVAMAHGLLVGSLASWYFTAAPALARRHRVLLYDLRGHGRSSRPAEGYDVASHGRDLRALLDHAFGDAPVSLVGHSYGALVAMAVALESPARVRRLVLVEAPLPPSRFEEVTGFLRKTPAEMIDALPAELRNVVEGGGRRGRRFLEHVTALVAGTTFVADLIAEPDLPDERLASITCETTLVYGTRSAARSVGERLARAMPNARLHLLEGGHFLPTEAPAALTALLLGALDG